LTYAPNGPLNFPLFANNLATAIDSKIRPSYTTTFNFEVAFGSIYCWIWDGTVLHAGSGGAGGVGGLPTINKDIRWTVLVKKYTLNPSEQTLGWWHSPPVNSTWVTPNYNLNILGYPQWQNVASRWFGSPVLADGNIWHPAVYTKNWVPGVFIINQLQVMPRLHFYKKRGNTPNTGVHVHDNTWLPPTPTPTANG